MSALNDLWGRARVEVGSFSQRARRGADRAFRIGVLQIDLVSLRRDRTRAHAHLGERVLALWRAGALESLPTDPEAERLRDYVRSIEESIAAKEAEVVALRAAAPTPAASG